MTFSDISMSFFLILGKELGQSVARYSFAIRLTWIGFMDVSSSFNCKLKPENKDVMCSLAALDLDNVFFNFSSLEDRIDTSVAMGV